jgi:hypothetical protein
MVIQYHFEHIWVLLGVVSYLVAFLLVIRSIIDTSDATTGWKFFWSAVVVSIPVIGVLAWLVFVRIPTGKRSKD